MSMGMVLLAMQSIITRGSGYDYTNIKLLNILSVLRVKSGTGKSFEPQTLIEQGGIIS